MKKISVLFFLLIFIFPFCVLAEQIDINSASLEQLKTLTGIGDVKARAIIDARPFSSVDDLIRVKGIGEKTLQKIKEQGWACVNCATTQIAENSSQTTNSAATAPENNAPLITQATPDYPTGVYVNEILPNPSGADEQNEWIELYNSNNFDVDLSGWRLQDRAGAITTYTIPSITKVLANGFLVFKRPDTKITLNNEGDGVNLMTPDGKIVDSVGFLNAPLGQSYNKTQNSWAWSTTLTPGVRNIVAIAAVKTNNNLPKTQKSGNNNVETASLLNAAENLNTSQDSTSPWFLFFGVLISTTILAVIVLFIKFKFKENVGT